MILAEFKERRNSEWPQTTINTVITNTNMEKLEGIIHLARETRCSAGLYFSSLVVHDESSAQFRLTPDQEARLPEILSKTAALASAHGLAHNLLSLMPDHANAGSSSRKNGQNEFVDALCFEAWISAAVLPDGRVGPCCMFWDEEADRIGDASLREVWLGPYMQRVRQNLSTHRGLPSYCRLCHSGIPPRTKEFHDEMLARQWDRWSRLSWEQRIRLIGDRIMQNIRNRGLRQTVRRAHEWSKLRFRKHSETFKDKQ